MKILYPDNSRGQFMLEKRFWNGMIKNFSANRQARYSYC